MEEVLSETPNVADLSKTSEEPVVEEAEPADEEPVVEEELEKCPCCQEFPLAAVGFSSCIHIICSGCLAKLAETHRQDIPCPLCRVPFDGITMKEDIDTRVRQIVGDSTYIEMLRVRSQENTDTIRDRPRVQNNHQPDYGPPPSYRPGNQSGIDINSILIGMIPQIPQIINQLMQKITDYTDARKYTFKIFQPIKYLAMIMQMMAFCFICVTAISNESTRFVTTCFIILFGTGHIIREAIYELSQ